MKLPILYISDSFGGKQIQNKTLWSGAVLMAGASRIWQFVKTNFLRVEGGKILRGLAFDFLPFFTTSFEPRAVERNVFYHLSPGPAPPPPQPL